MHMNIHIATSDKDIAACYPVMRELRPHIAEDEFLMRVRGQQSAGYRLAMVQVVDVVVAVAGFRVTEYMAWGRFLYVDDLVTLPAQRSRGVRLRSALLAQGIRGGRRLFAAAPRFRHPEKERASLL